MNCYRIVSIGTTCNIKMNSFTGQAVMFDGVVDYARQTGIKVDVLDISSRFIGGKFGRILDYVCVLLKLLILLLKNKYNLAYIITSQSKYGFYRDFLMISICKIFKLKVITHQYGGNYSQLLSSINKKDLKRLKSMLDYVSKVIVEGDYMKGQFAFYNGYENKVVVVPNGLPVEGLNICKEKVWSNKDSFKILYLSNLILSKGYFDVLKAVDVLVNKYKRNVECLFVGKFLVAPDDTQSEIYNKETFDRYIVEKGLNRRVQYRSGLYGEEKDRAFYESNVFTLPSYYINEGQPVSIIEAMAYGCVPIVTKFRHIPMMVNYENGCFVQAKSPESIASVIIDLMDNPDIYNGKSRKAIEDYTNHFRFDIFATKVMNIFYQVIN